eukprot:770653_1
MGLCHSANENEPSDAIVDDNNIDLSPKESLDTAIGDTNIDISPKEPSDAIVDDNNIDLSPKESLDAAIGDTNIDLKVYRNEDTGSVCNGDDIENCIAFKRIATGLQYYSPLDIVHNKNDEKIFTHFIAAVYGDEMQNDYIHIIRKHNHQIQQMK